MFPDGGGWLISGRVFVRASPDWEGAERGRGAETALVAPMCCSRVWAPMRGRVSMKCKEWGPRDVSAD